jgi:hypothetical protein
MRIKSDGLAPEGTRREKLRLLVNKISLANGNARALCAFR